MVSALHYSAAASNCSLLRGSGNPSLQNAVQFVQENLLPEHELLLLVGKGGVLLGVDELGRTFNLGFHAVQIGLEGVLRGWSGSGSGILRFGDRFGGRRRNGRLLVF